VIRHLLACYSFRSTSYSADAEAPLRCLASPHLLPAYSARAAASAQSACSNQITWAVCQMLLTNLKGVASSCHSFCYFAPTLTKAANAAVLRAYLFYHNDYGCHCLVLVRADASLTGALSHYVECPSACACSIWCGARRGLNAQSSRSRRPPQRESLLLPHCGSRNSFDFPSN
jgi:hypothetical protein